MRTQEAAINYSVFLKKGAGKQGKVGEADVGGQHFFC